MNNMRYNLLDKILPSIEQIHNVILTNGTVVILFNNSDIKLNRTLARSLMRKYERNS